VKVWSDISRRKLAVFKERLDGNSFFFGGMHGREEKNYMTHYSKLLKFSK
jgi:hypothetical protein